MRLAPFILANLEPILLAWENFARSILPAAKMDSIGLRDHAHEILQATVRDMQTDSRLEYALQTSGDGETELDTDAVKGGASAVHAIGRFDAGFDLLQLISEYRALRASVLQLWARSLREVDENDVHDISRFHESVDLSLAKAVSCYTKHLEESRDMFLAILGHDLRSPLSAISMSARLLPVDPDPSRKTNQLAPMISKSAKVMSHMISDLLDYTRTRLGAGMPLKIQKLDLAELCNEVIEECRAANPQIQLRTHIPRAVIGFWDPERLRQVISNLLGNAVQHGDCTAGIEITIRPDNEQVYLTICNQGIPIPAGELRRIFDPLVRGTSAGRRQVNRPGSIGLGLYIARELILAHGGTITATSDAALGTIFSFRLPCDLPH